METICMVDISFSAQLNVENLVSLKFKNGSLFAVGILNSSQILKQKSGRSQTFKEILSFIKNNSETSDWRKYP